MNMKYEYEICADQHIEVLSFSARTCFYGVQGS